MRTIDKRSGSCAEFRRGAIALRQQVEIGGAAEAAGDGFGRLQGPAFHQRLPGPQLFLVVTAGEVVPPVILLVQMVADDLVDDGQLEHAIGSEFDGVGQSDGRPRCDEAFVDGQSHGDAVGAGAVAGKRDARERVACRLLGPVEVLAGELGQPRPDGQVGLRVGQLTEFSAGQELQLRHRDRRRLGHALVQHGVHVRHRLIDEASDVAKRERIGGLPPRGPRRRAPRRAPACAVVCLNCFICLPPRIRPGLMESKRRL